MTTHEPRRLAVFSDVHSNLHALEAVLNAIDELGIKEMVCCGDVVGYGAYPNECVDILRRRNIPTLAGNHDHAALGLTDVNYFNEIAKLAVFWTRERLTPENAAWLRERPFTHEIGNKYFFVHASPFQPDQWGYVLTFGDARIAFERFSHTFCFIGHSHQPALVVKRGEDLSCPEESSVAIEKGCRYLINVGSVGQPRESQSGRLVRDGGPESRDDCVSTGRPTRCGPPRRRSRNEELPPELADRLGFGW